MANIPQLVTTGGAAGKGETIKSGSGKLNSTITSVNSLSERITSAEGQLTILSGVPGAIDDIYAKIALTQQSISLVVSSTALAELSSNVNGSVTSIPVTPTAITLDAGDFIEIPNQADPESPFLMEVSANVAAGATSIPIRPRGGTGPVVIEADAGSSVILDGFTLLAKIEILKDEISTKVSQSVIDDLEDAIELLETQIQQNATQISLRATKAEFDTLEGRVDLAEAAIVVNAEAISLAVQQGSATELGVLGSPLSGTVTSVTLSLPIPADLLNGENILIYNEVTDTLYGTVPNQIFVQGNYLATNNVVTFSINNGTLNTGVSITAPAGSKVYLSGSALLGKIQVNANNINLAVSAERYIDDLEAVNVGVRTDTTYYNGVSQITLSVPIQTTLYSGDEVTLIPLGNRFSPLIPPQPGDFSVRRVLTTNPATSGSVYRSGTDTVLAFTQTVQIRGPFVVRLDRRGRFGTVAQINLNENGVTIEGNRISLVGNAEFNSMQSNVTQAVNTSNNALATALTKIDANFFAGVPNQTLINGGFIQTGTIALTRLTPEGQEALVLKSGVIAAINNSGEPANLKILADRLNLTGYVTVSSLTGDIAGNVTTIDGGKIAASSRVTVGSAPNIAILNGSTVNDPSWRLWVGASAPLSAPFRVSQSGALTATNATLTGSLTASGGDNSSRSVVTLGQIRVEDSTGSAQYVQIGKTIGFAAGYVVAVSPTSQTVMMNNGILAFKASGFEGFTSLLSIGTSYTAMSKDVWYLKSTEPNANKAALEVESTTGGVLFPRMTSTQRNAIASPPNGLMIYNTTLNRYETRVGTNWFQMSMPSGNTATRTGNTFGNRSLFYDETTDSLWVNTFADGWKELAFVP
jgi:hypothetical protein